MSKIKEHYHDEITTGQQNAVVKFYPILFSTEMVLAILAGRKTMTRRIITQHNSGECIVKKKLLDFSEIYPNGSFGIKVAEKKDNNILWRVDFPYQIGDILWVRETFGFTKGKHEPIDFVSYKADNLHVDVLRTGVKYYNETLCSWNDAELAKCVKWKPSIHMPKKFCRLFLKITDIRVEKINNISEEDAKAEGVEYWYEKNHCCERYKDYSEVTNGFFADRNIIGCSAPEASFRSLWAKIHGFDSLNANPYVWVIKFERCEKPENF